MRSPLETDIDLLSPPPPAPPFHDPASGEWVLSRYADVLAAFREPLLETVNAQNKGGDASAQARLRADTIGALPALKLSAWQAQVEPLAHDLLERLPRDSSIDIIKEFAQPWSLDLAVIVTGAASPDAERLRDLARDVSAATADPSNALLQSRAKAASSELARTFDKAPLPMSGPAFVALSQTLPAFLANAWLALLRHPAEWEKLRDHPDLMPLAIEELLRYVGLARMLFRRATGTFDLAGNTITEGARVILLLSSANRDPMQFSEPDRLDIARRSGPPLALGAGPHSCAGGSLIRMAAAVATRALLENVGTAQIDRPVEWYGGSGFRSARSIYLTLAPRRTKASDVQTCSVRL